MGRQTFLISIRNLSTAKVLVISTLAVFIITISHCNRKPDEKYGVREMRFIVNYPVVLTNKSFFNLKDTITIFYVQNFILYRLLATRKIDTNDKQLGTEPYFIYQKDNNYGFLYNSLISKNNKKLPTDSFLLKKAFLNTAFGVPEDSLWILHSRISEGNKYLMEKYIPRKNFGENSVDSVYYYYDNQIFNEYSLSKKLDSVKKMKLFKVRLLYNEKYSQVNKFNIPKREFLFEIKMVSVSNREAIIDFVERFKKEHNDN